MSMLRGEDATGVAGVREVTNENKQKIPVISVYKRAIHAVDYMNTKGFNRILDRFGDYHYVLGHVRASTVGGALDINAHPFMYGDITLIHNGTVNKNNLKVRADEDVDSAHIALAVATHGELPALEMLDGGYSLVWHNAEDDTINFARNERKPMAIAYVKNRNELYYASEYRVLWAVLGRNGIEIDGDIKVPAINTHYKFHKEDLRKLTATPYKAYTARPFRPDAWNGSHQRPVVHGETKEQPKSMVIQTDAHASRAGNSTENGQRETSGTDIPGQTKTTEVLRPRPERINKLNELLKDYGWSYETSLVLQPTHYAAPDPKKGHPQGRLYLEMVDVSHQPPHIEFCMYWVSPTRADYFEGIGRVAVKLDNFLQQSDGTLRIIVKESYDLQKVIERADDVIQTLEAHGFGPEPKGGSKSNDQADQDDGFAQVAYNPITGEILEEDPTAHIGSDLVKGPGGTSIAFREFRELCKGGCGMCDGDIDPQLPGGYSWMGSDLICEECTNSPNKQHELGRWKH